MAIFHHSAALQSTTSVDTDDEQHSVDGDTSLEYPRSPAQWTHAGRPISRAVSTFSPVSGIPPELLINVLRHIHSPRDLFQALLVSRTWCECSVELLWHKPVFTQYDTLLKMARLLASPAQSFTYPSFIRRLNFLSLGKSLRDDVFSTLANCTRLERLTLVNCDLLSTDALHHVLPNFPNLVAIDLTGVGNTTDDAIVGLAITARRLQGINLAGCKYVSDLGVMALAENCPLLRRVKLSGVALVTDEPVSALAKNCPLLLEIDLNKCSLISDRSIRDIWRYSTHMREMRLSHCSELTDAAFPSTVGLEPGVADGTNPFVAARIRHNSDQLPPLIISRSFEHLRMLDLTACSLVTDDAVEGIISHAPKIRNLVLSKCSLLTDRAVDNICKLGKHLHYLHLGHAARITDPSVRNLARSCSRLRYIDFANCTLLTDMSVFELSTLHKLRRVGLVRVNQLTDDAIYSLAKGLHTLERIHLSYCDQISVMAIHFLLQRLHKLTHLSLTGVPTFRNAELQQFCREPPKDFNATQQQAFCVYSGKGVAQLRSFLSELFDQITDMNEDDMEFEEDDTEPEATREEEDPQQQASLAGDDEEDLSNRMMNGLNLPAGNQETLDLHASVNEAFMSGPAGSPATERGYPGAASSGRRPRGPIPTHRNIADSIPVVDNSPPPSDVASNRSVGTNQSNGATFFRTYHDLTAAAARSTGVRTPDLNYAEIGHGPGAQTTPTAAAAGGNVPPPLQMRRGGNDLAPRSRQAMDSSSVVTTPSSRNPTPSTRGSSASSIPFASSASLAQPQPQPQRQITESPVASSGPAWPYQEPVSPTNSNATAAVAAATDTAEGGERPRAQPAQQSHSQGHGGERTVRRSIRNTLNDASSFLFGHSRSSQEGARSRSGSGSATRR